MSTRSPRASFATTITDAPGPRAPPARAVRQWAATPHALPAGPAAMVLGAQGAAGRRGRRLLRVNADHVHGRTIYPHRPPLRRRVPVHPGTRPSGGAAAVRRRGRESRRRGVGPRRALPVPGRRACPRVRGPVPRLTRRRRPRQVPLRRGRRRQDPDGSAPSRRCQPLAAAASAPYGVTVGRRVYETPVVSFAWGRAAAPRPSAPGRARAADPCRFSCTHVLETRGCQLDGFRAGRVPRRLRDMHNRPQGKSTPKRGTSVPTDYPARAARDATRRRPDGAEARSPGCSAPRRWIGHGTTLAIDVLEPQPRGERKGTQWQKS